MPHQPATSRAHAAGESVEDVQISGHIIDSLILPKILDIITAGGGNFSIKRITIGQARNDPSYALVEVEAPTDELLRQIVQQITDHGAVPTHAQDCQLLAADIKRFLERWSADAQFRASLPEDPQRVALVHGLKADLEELQNQLQLHLRIKFLGISHAKM